MTICTANTAAGHPCKNYTVPGPQFCKAHGTPTPPSALSAVQLPDESSIEVANEDLFAE